jgi:asparagine synthase (glutamine-hydrolysing)
MPGIAGIISKGPDEECQSLVQSMINSMEYERFYDSGLYSDVRDGQFTQLGWSHENSFGTSSQPFVSEQRDVVLLFSGECFVGCRNACSTSGKKDINLGSQPLSWLVHLYEEEGDRFFEKLNGLFSGLLIDKRRQAKAFLFNDRYGVERIYWHEDRGCRLFRQRSQGAVASLTGTYEQFDKEGVSSILGLSAVHVGAANVVSRRIRLLPGGSVWSFENGKCHKRKYFSPESWQSQATLTS